MSQSTISVTEPQSTPTAGIQEAIDALGPGGGCVLLPAGVFDIRRQIDLPDRVTLRGQGRGTVLRGPQPRTIRLAEDAEPPADTLTLAEDPPFVPGDELLLDEPWYARADKTQRRGGYNSRLLEVVEVRGRTLHCKALYGKDENDYRTRFSASVHSVHPAIMIRNAAGAAVEDLAIEGHFAPDPDAPWRQHASNFLAAAVSVEDAGCTIRGVTVRGWGSDGITCSGKAADVLVTGCLVEGCAGIGFHPGGGLRAGRFAHNESRRNETGLLFCQGNRNVIVSGNLLHHNRTDGIKGLGDPDRYCQVIGNCCYDNGRYGIEAYNAVGNVIANNICRNNSQSQPGLYAGIHLEKHRDNAVTGNICLDDQRRATQTVGLAEINPAGANVVANNHCPPASGYMHTWAQAEREAARAKQ